MLRRLLSQFSQMPKLMQVGIFIFYFGALLDLLYHASLPGTLDAYLGQGGLLAHLVILAGMVMILLGVFARGLQVSFRQRPGSSAK